MAANNSSNTKVFGILDVAFLKLLLLPAGVTLFMLSTISILFTPWIDNIKADSVTTNDFLKKNEKLQEKISYLKSIDPKNLEDNAIKFNDAIFAEKNSYFLIDVIRSSGDEVGFSIANFSLSPGEVKQDSNSAASKKVATNNSAQRIPVEVSMIGPRDRFIEFIERLEKTLPVLSIDELQMRTEQNMMKLDLTISAFFVPTNTDKKIDTLELADLTLTADEKNLVERLGEFKKAKSLERKTVTATSSADFVKYQKANPFGF